MRSFALAHKRPMPVRRPGPTTRSRSQSARVEPQRQRIGRIPHGPQIQPKLALGRPDDAYERESDRIADAVMRMPDPQPAGPINPGGQTAADRIQRLCSDCQEEVRRQPAEEEEEEELQAKAASGPAPSMPARADGLIRRVRQSPAQLLPGSVRRFMEPRFGIDFGQVRVHSGHAAAEAARAINARAFTVGRDVVFGAGQYAPEAREGQRLLAHELTHVVQQGGGRARPGSHRSSSALDRPRIRQVPMLTRLGAPTLMRKCGRVAIGEPKGCLPVVGDPSGERFRFVLNCDDFQVGEKAKLVDFAADLSAEDSVVLHGVASQEGDAIYNEHLSCARALKVLKVLTAEKPEGGGLERNQIIDVFNHGATSGLLGKMRSVTVEKPAKPSPRPSGVELIYLSKPPGTPVKRKQRPDPKKEHVLFNIAVTRRDILLAKGAAIFFFIPADPANKDVEKDPGVLLVIEKGYLNKIERKRIAGEIIQAYREVPRLLEQVAATKRMTVYLYRGGPISTAQTELGFRDGEAGIFLKRPFEGTAKQKDWPVFHEFAHIFAGEEVSQSLDEGLAAYVQGRFRPGQADLYFPFVKDPHRASRSDRLWNDPDKIGKIGAIEKLGSKAFKGDAERKFFYRASWSFVYYLLHQIPAPKDETPMQVFLEVYRGTETYEEAYGKTLEVLRAEWRRWVEQTYPRP